MEKFNDVFINKKKYPTVIETSATTAYKHIGTVYLKGFLYNGCRFSLNLSGLFSYVRNKQIHSKFDISIQPKASADGYQVDCEYNELESHSFSDDENIALPTDFIKFVAVKSFEDGNNFVFNKVDIYIKNNPKTYIGYSIDNIVFSGVCDFELSKDIYVKTVLPSSTIALDVNIYPARDRNITPKVINSNASYTSSLTKVFNRRDKLIKFVGKLQPLSAMAVDTLLIYAEAPSFTTTELRFIVPCDYVDYTKGWATIGVATSGAIYLRNLDKTVSNLSNLNFDGVSYYCV